MGRRELYAWILATAISVGLFGWLPETSLGRSLPALGCQSARQTAAFALRERFGERWTEAKRRHLACERPRISGTRWRTRFGFWNGGPFIFYGTVIVWRWPYDPTRNAYWLTPHLTRR